MPGTRARSVSEGGKSHRINALAFSADSTRLASGGSDRTIVVWDVTGRQHPRPPGQLTEKQLDDLWTALGDANPNRAAAAVYVLANHPSVAIPWLGRRLKQVPRKTPAQVAALIVDLDDRRFAVRKQAEVELGRCAHSVAPALRQALKNNLWVEAGTQIRRILDSPRSWSTEQLQAQRSIQVLAASEDAQARAMLERIASGAPRAPQTQAAKSALESLRHE